MQKLASLTGEVKHYEWGGTSLIPSLLGIENKAQQPYAEYWMGIHSGASCSIALKDGRQVLLRDYIRQNPDELLGEKVAAIFGAQPFLLKVLDVSTMLSIQVHPSKKQAAIDFERENAAGIPLNAPSRNYKDANHKPELMVALSEFYLLHGFKPEAELRAVLQSVDALDHFIPIFEEKGYAGLYREAMEMPQRQVNELLQPLLDKIIPLYRQGSLDKKDADFWAARAALTFINGNDIDRGIFSIYFFNVLQLQKGDAVFQDAGVPHAYLEGYNVELMASSDNVLRGGLTSKYIDVPELLKHTRCVATYPRIIKGDPQKGETIYETPAEDFQLSAFEIEKDGEVQIVPVTAEILLITSGEAEVSNADTTVLLTTGQIAAAIFPGTSVKVKAVQKTQLFRASVPVK